MVSDIDTESAKRFDNFLESMSDTEYEYWYDEEATNAQRDLADHLRESVSPDDAESYIIIRRDALRQFFGED